MIRIDDIAIFVSAADHGSISAAARQLDLAPAVASVALQRLERALGARLFARTTRSMRLTLDGERYLTHARVALAELDAGRGAIVQGREVVGGPVTVSMPSDLGRNVLLGWLDDFQEVHPGVSFNILVADRVTDLFRQPVDIAVRYGTLQDSSLIALPLAEDNRRVLCAAPAYLARCGVPDSPEALAEHNCLRYAMSETIFEDWTFYPRDGTTAVTVKVSGDRVTDDADLVHRWAVQGRGIAYKSRLDLQADLKQGILQEILPDFVGQPTPLQLVCTHRLAISPTVTALRDYLQVRLQAYLTD